MEGVLSKTPSALLEIPIKIQTPVHFLKCFGLVQYSPTPRNSNPICVGSMDIFWNSDCT